MENLELQTQVINLGKQFVNELGLDSSLDTFSKWMAHYIAEKMTSAEQLPSGEDKKEAEKECFDTILKLWEHRWLLPSGHRPLEKFEPILKVLERINPDRIEPFFYRFSKFEEFEEEKTGIDFKEIDGHIKMIVQIDKTARIMIDLLLRQAALMAKDEKIEKLLKNSVSLDDNDDAKTIRILLNDDLANYEDTDVQKKYQIEKIKKRIKEFEKFGKLNRLIIKNYRKVLSEL
jgi:hypothetical protein